MGLTYDVDALISEVRRRVIDWEKRNWIPYPWRVGRTPYKVLIAEVLLKRTTRQAVLREFHKFLTKFPDIHTLYKAPIEEVAESLKHLGLYRQRAEQLKQMAKAIVERYGGKIPDKWEDLVGLPGAGPYIAGAVLSFGYGKPAPVVDSNVMRVLSRLFDVEFKNYENCVRVLQRLLPEEDHEYFNYGLIDLGALVCGYKEVRCGVCPLRELCITYLRTKDKVGADYLRQVYTKLLLLQP